MHGVNLGNWLVLEKWMNPTLFNGTDAEDETSFCLCLSETDKRLKLDSHRSSYITARDFAHISAMGFDAVRIPVPFFLFEDVGPYISCVKYLDKAFDWAEEYHLDILLDLHTVPGGQNGSDNSGISGICIWANHPEYVEYTLDVLEKLAQRYGNRAALYGIEVLNEPMCSDTAVAPFMNIRMIQQQYPPAYPELAKESCNYTLGFLKDFYRKSYRHIRKYLPLDKYVVFSDAFCVDIWTDFFEESELENIVLDTHQYLVLPELMDPSPNTQEKYLRIIDRIKSDLSLVSAKIPVIVGEWCLQNSALGLQDWTSEQKKQFYSTIYNSYLDAMKDCEGWFYWSYKLLNEDPTLFAWDAQRCVDSGWIF